MSVIYSPLRAALRVLEPKEEKLVQQEAKFKRQLFLRNVTRLKAVIVYFLEWAQFIQWVSRISCLFTRSPSSPNVCSLFDIAEVALNGNRQFARLSLSLCGCAAAFGSIYQRFRPSCWLLFSSMFPSYLYVHDSAFDDLLANTFVFLSCCCIGIGSSNGSPAPHRIPPNTITKYSAKTKTTTTKTKRRKRQLKNVCKQYKRYHNRCKIPLDGSHRWVKASKSNVHTIDSHKLLYLSQHACIATQNWK